LFVVQEQKIKLSLRTKQKMHTYKIDIQKTNSRYSLNLYLQTALFIKTGHKILKTIKKSLTFLLRIC